MNLNWQNFLEPLADYCALRISKRGKQISYFQNSLSIEPQASEGTHMHRIHTSGKCSDIILQIGAQVQREKVVCAKQAWVLNNKF